MLSLFISALLTSQTIGATSQPTSTPTPQPISLHTLGGSFGAWWYVAYLTDITNGYDIQKFEVQSYGSNIWLECVAEGVTVIKYQCAPSSAFILPLSVRLTETTGQIIISNDLITEYTGDVIYNFGDNFGANKDTPSPTSNPSESPTIIPSISPTIMPSELPTIMPSISPTFNPTRKPTDIPTFVPTKIPTTVLSVSPTYLPTNYPSKSPTYLPTNYPSKSPTYVPTNYPSKSPIYQIQSPTNIQTNIPSISPTKSPTMFPTVIPTTNPSNTPTIINTLSPTKHPTIVTLQTIPSDAIETSNDQLPTTYTLDSYSSQNKNTLNSLLKHVSVTWAIIAILISFVICCGCCLCYYIHSAYTQQRKLREKEEETSMDTSSDLEINKYTIPQKLNVIVPSKSSAASMKSSNYSNCSSDGYDTYVNALNVAATPTYVSPKHTNGIGEDSIQSHNNSVGSYKNQSHSEWQYNNNNMQVMNRNQLWQMQRSPAVSYPFNQQPIAYYPSYNSKMFALQPMPMPIASPQSAPAHMFSTLQYNNNLLNVNLPPAPPESVSTNGNDNDNISVSTSTETDTRTDSAIDRCHKYSTTSLNEQKAEEFIEYTKNKTLKYSICHNDEKEEDSKQIIQLHNALKSIDNNIDSDNESDGSEENEPGACDHKSNMSNQSVQTVITVIERNENDINENDSDCDDNE